MQLLVPAFRMCFSLQCPLYPLSPYIWCDVCRKELLNLGTIMMQEQTEIDLHRKLEDSL